jgi:hypothetical protein
MTSSMSRPSADAVFVMIVRAWAFHGRRVTVSEVVALTKIPRTTFVKCLADEALSAKLLSSVEGGVRYLEPRKAALIPLLVQDVRA